MKKIISNKWVWGGVVLLAGVLFFFLRPGTDASSESVAEDTAVVFVGDLLESATASGQVQAQQEASLALASSGVVAKVHVAVGDSVAAGQLLIELETAALQRNLRSAEADLLIAQANLTSLLDGSSAADIASAEASVASARAKLSQRQAGPTEEEIAASEQSVKAAQANVAAASGRLSALYDVSQADILAAENSLVDALAQQKAAKDMWARLADCTLQADGSYSCVAGDNDRMRSANLNVELANAQVTLAQTRLNDLKNPQTTNVGTAQASVQSAQAQYEATLARHQALLSGSSAASIAAAEAEMANAEASLAKVISGPLDTDRRTAELQVVQAEIAVKEAKLAIENRFVYAPFSGIITDLFVSEGEQASGVVLNLVSGDRLEVVLTVDEVDMSRIQVGQAAVVTLESWPAVELPSEVNAIAPVASNSSSGVVAYDVHLLLGATELPILVGMTANASLITANRENILLVPNGAVTADRQAGTYSVNLIRMEADGTETVSEVNVTIGLKDNKHTQILSGLQEGDEVAIGQLVIPTINFGPGN